MSDELAMPNQECCVFAETRDALGRHNLLRGQLGRATELAARVVLEQKPPLCQVLLPLHRLFQEFSSELDSYIELEETALFPNVLASVSGRIVSADLSETVRLLKHGQDTLLRVLAEMCELTQGFLAPIGACPSYVELLQVLQAVQTELVWEFCLEAEVLFPRALAYAESSVMQVGGFSC